MVRNRLFSQEATERTNNGSATSHPTLSPDENAAESLERVQQRIQMHDRFQVELKLDYELIAGKETRYRINTYIFVPQSLGISAKTYTQREFYRDVHSYIRLKTPVFTLWDVLQDASSPLCRMEALLNTPDWTQTPAHRTQLITHFRFLRAILKSALREFFQEHNLRRSAPAKHPMSAEAMAEKLDAIDTLADTTTTILQRYRALNDKMEHPGVHTDVRRAYQLTDESMSMLVEERLLLALALCEQMAGVDELENVKGRLRSCIRHETMHRARYGKTSTINPNDGNEDFVYRSSVLKKFTSSVLFLSTDIHQEGTALKQISYAVSAGIAMVFATVVAFYFQRAYGMFTFPLFVALVVGYMFKDRIKEGGRVLLSHYLRNKLYDHRIIIKTQDGEQAIGVLREKMRFMSEHTVPSDVMAARNRQMFTDLDNDGMGEQVICYTKEVVLYRDIFDKTYPDSPPITGLNDIMRYDIRTYLRRMANPVQRKLYLDGDALKSVRCHKVYHINMISTYHLTTPAQAKTITKTRVVLNRKGIRRVERVEV